MSSKELAGATWRLDETNTHVIVNAETFRFRNISATLELVSGEARIGENAAGARLSFTLSAASFSTGNRWRDRRVRGGDFLQADSHPSIEFESDSVVEKASGRYAISGTLVVADVSTHVRFNITDVLVAGTTATFQAAAELDRRELGISKLSALFVSNPIGVNVTGTAHRVGSPM